MVAATEAARTSSREAAAAVAAGKFRLCASSLQLRLTYGHGNGKVALDVCSEGSLCSRLWGII